jgi:hypothetical protein
VTAASAAGASAELAMLRAEVAALTAEAAGIRAAIAELTGAVGLTVEQVRVIRRRERELVAEEAAGAASPARQPRQGRTRLALVSPRGAQ